jgi:hypothetical protein
VKPGRRNAITDRTAAAIYSILPLPPSITSSQTLCADGDNSAMQENISCSMILVCGAPGRPQDAVARCAGWLPLLPQNRCQAHLAFHWRCCCPPSFAERRRCFPRCPHSSFAFRPYALTEWSCAGLLGSPEDEAGSGVFRVKAHLSERIGKDPGRSSGRDLDGLAKPF